jgi:S-adenosylmethionine:tRNA ribosyltransferase-isomerase
MKVEIFDFPLDETLIAQAPNPNRDEARLLSIPSLQDFHVYDLPKLLRKGDLLVLNDTKVIPARLFGKKGEAEIELMLYADLGNACWQAFARPGKKLKVGDEIKIASNFIAKVLEKNGMDGVKIEFNLAAQNLTLAIAEHGHLPLPPYIKRSDNAQDRQDYQTIYAKNLGAVAAPTAGLHFTQKLFDELENCGIKKTFLTLHVGAGTFLPMKALDTEEHKMHAEYGIISEESANLINETRRNGGHIVAVGTTSLRMLETAADKNGVVQAMQKSTDIFITPGYKFRAVDILFTNFHLPKSTLFMLVCAAAGIEEMKQAYKVAQERKYKFFSYGDATLIEIKK